MLLDVGTKERGVGMAGTMTLDKEWGLLKEFLHKGVSARTPSQMERTDYLVRAAQWRRMVSTGDRWSAFCAGARHWMAQQGAVAASREEKSKLGPQLSQKLHELRSEELVDADGVTDLQAEDCDPRIEDDEPASNLNCDLRQMTNGKELVDADGVIYFQENGELGIEDDEQASDLDGYISQMTEGELEKLEEACRKRRLKQAGVQLAKPLVEPVALSDTVVWRVLESTWNLPPDVISSFFSGLALYFGEEVVTALFGEEWLARLERWLPFAELVQERSATSTGGEVLPAVFTEFRALLFAVVRCVRDMSCVPYNLAGSDAEHLEELKAQGYSRVAADGDDNNCLIHSLAIALSLQNFISMPKSTRATFQEIRRYLVQTPGLHPSLVSGQKCVTAFLEHGVHADAIVRRLHTLLGSTPLPVKGIRVSVHARYDVPGESPPGTFMVGAGMSLDEQESAPVADSISPSVQVHLYNWTGEGCSGFHYDALVAGIALGHSWQES